MLHPGDPLFWETGLPAPVVRPLARVWQCGCGYRRYMSAIQTFVEDVPVVDIALCPQCDGPAA